MSTEQVGGRERVFHSIEEIEYELLPDRYEERIMEAGPEVYGRWVAHQLFNDFRRNLGQDEKRWNPVKMKPADPHQGGDRE